MTSPRNCIVILITFLGVIAVSAREGVAGQHACTHLIEWLGLARLGSYTLVQYPGPVWLCLESISRRHEPIFRRQLHKMCKVNLDWLLACVQSMTCVDSVVARTVTQSSADCLILSLALLAQERRSTVPVVSMPCDTGP